MNPENFDSELKTYYQQIKREIQKEHQEYISQHPEIREIVNDFMSSVLLEKPKEVYKYATNYFSYFNINKDKITHKPLIISGPTGVGKGTMISKLIKDFPNFFEQNIAYTSRPPRQGETQGVQYFFVTRAEFEKEISKGSFYQYVDNHGEYFGTHKGKMNYIISQGKVCLLELDVQCAKTVYAEHPDFKFVFLRPRSIEVCEQRLKEKGGYNEQQLRKRLDKGKIEIDLMNNQQANNLRFFYEIINDKIDKTYDDLVKFIKSQYLELKL